MNFYEQFDTDFDKACKRAADAINDGTDTGPDLVDLERRMRQSTPTFFSPFFLDLRACAETNS